MAKKKAKRAAATGRIEVHPRGFGFVVVDGAHGDEPRSAFVKPAALERFLADDVVEAKLAEAHGRWSATDLKLVTRSRGRVFGEVALKGGARVLRVDRHVSNADWKLDAPDEAPEPGDFALARVAGDRLVLERRLARGADPSLERVLARHGLARGFGEAALEEARQVRSRAHELGRRRDLRDVPTITVDSPSTRDIDDAISVLPADDDGTLTLLVSIADVAEFVPEGTPLDREARERGTSVYLANAKLPMFPEELSAGFLSLVPDEDRSCVTVEIRLDPAGEIAGVDVYESLVRSRARLDYAEVAAYLERGESGERMERVRDALPWLRAASARLAALRARRGGTERARDEARLTFDAETGEVTGIEPIVTTPAHAMIERFMVAANEAVASWLVERQLPAIYRVQKKPDPDELAGFEEFARHSGFAAGFGRELTAPALAAFERQLEGSGAEAALRSVLRRILGPTKYSARAGPHFGLAAAAYCHFTSPIRRYADLAVHRILKRWLRGERDFAADEAALAKLAPHVDARSRAASRAEADQHRMLEARYMARHAGETFPAHVTRVKPFGLLVQLDRLLVEGVVPTEALSGGPWKVDGRETRLASKQRTWCLGMPIVVRLASTDEHLGRVEFAPAAE